MVRTSFFATWSQTAILSSLLFLRFRMPKTISDGDRGGGGLALARAGCEREERSTADEQASV